MTMLSNKELELFKSILGCRQGGLKKSMEEFLVKLYGKKSVIIEKEYIVAIGDIPVGLVAHLDTVHKTPAYQVFYDKDENVLWSPQGLGADDRAGVYAIVELLTRDYKPTVIFTTDEEKGGLGASALVSDFPKPPFEVNYLIELDRQGGNDSVFYECANQDFERYINRFGFLTEWGSFSDISFICPTWGIAGVNLSIGYHLEHSLGEYLRVDEMISTINRVSAILDSVTDSDKFEYVEIGVSSRNPGYEQSNYLSDSFTTPSETEEICWHCMEIYDITMIAETQERETYCIDCYNELIDYCELCGKEFKNHDKLYTHLCIQCEINNQEKRVIGHDKKHTK